MQEQTKTLPEIADELQVPEGTLREWMRLYRKFENEPILTPDTLRERDRTIAKQSREIEDLQEQITILKKAMHIFSKEQS